MKLAVTIIVSGLFFIEIINQIYTEVMIRGLYKRLYTGSTKLSFMKRISWLKSNAEHFEIADQKRVKKIVFHRRLSNYFIGAMLCVFWGGVMLGVVK